jgi:hypothetical protein
VQIIPGSHIVLYEYVDCVAPGTLVYRLPAGGGYSYFGGKGTSYASPAVAAIAALMLQSDEYLTPEVWQQCCVTRPWIWDAAVVMCITDMVLSESTGFWTMLPYFTILLISTPDNN